MSNPSVTPPEGSPKIVSISCKFVWDISKLLYLLENCCSVYFPSRPSWVSGQAATSHMDKFSTCHSSNIMTHYNLVKHSLQLCNNTHNKSFTSPTTGSRKTIASILLSFNCTVINEYMSNSATNRNRSMLDFLLS